MCKERVMTLFGGAIAAYVWGTDENHQNFAGVAGLQTKTLVTYRNRLRFKWLLWSFRLEGHSKIF